MINFEYDLPVEKFFDKEEGILASHWDELAGNKEKIKLCPNIEAYKQLAEMGVMRNIVCFKDETLVGYAVLFLQPHIHYANDIFMSVDVIYVHPDHRNSSIGLRLISEVESLAKRENVSVLTYHTKPYHDKIEKILYRKGYKHSENIISKLIKE